MILVLDNLRSCYNVGSILRTADGFGCQKIIFIGTTPYPRLDKDQRLPYQISRQTAQITKTSLGAEKNIEGYYFPQVQNWLKTIKKEIIVSLEQTESSQPLENWRTKIDYLVVGNEIKGVSDLILKNSQQISINMLGQKESLNVAVATGIALYHLSLIK